MAADMVCAYYDCSVDTRGLFECRKISEPAKEYGSLPWDMYLNKFYVIHINMIDFATETNSVGEMLSYLEEEITGEMMSFWPDISFGSRTALRPVMEKIYNHTKVRYVIVIDEWDCIFRKYKEDLEGQVRYLDFLRGLLKDKSYIALACITGILPVKKYGEHSALNMFTEYSMTDPAQLAEYAGFTSVEVEGICRDYNLDFGEVTDWYDGYVVRGMIPVSERTAARKGEYRGNLFALYSPVSVVKSALTGILRNYWNETETAEALKEYIRRNFDGLKEDVAVLMQGRKIPCDVSTYQNDMTTFHSKDDIFTLLIHLGYLGYDSLTKEIFIPNKEVEEVFRQTMHVETVCLLSQRKPDTTIDVDLDISELEVSSAETKATYDEIQSYVLENYGLKVSRLYIAQVKEECGMAKRANYNLPRTENPKVLHCPEHKKKAIKDAFRHFQMI